MGEGQTNDVSSLAESRGAIGLTPIHSRIHCAATDDTSGNDDELEGIAIDHLLDTLAEVALAIARRREQLGS